MNYSAVLIERVSKFLQTYMIDNNLEQLTADEAAELLAENEILSNEVGPKPGFNFRQILREGRDGQLPLVTGAYQARPKTKWIIYNGNVEKPGPIKSKSSITKKSTRGKKPEIVKSVSQLNSPIIGLEPIIHNSTKILILGTFPAQESINAGLYYRNQNKRFWGQALSGIGNLERATKSERLSFLKENGIGLWDIFEAVEKDRFSNQDNSISKAKYNDLNSLLHKVNTIKYVVFNGKTGYKWFTKDHPNIPSEFDIKYVQLQSTSGANGHFNSGTDWYNFFKSIKL